MKEQLYELQKNYEDPCGRVGKGVRKTEEQWMARFALLNPGDCIIKKDWFKKAEKCSMCKEQPPQIVCWVMECHYYRNGDCTNIAPVVTLNPDKTFVCSSKEENLPSMANDITDILIHITQMMYDEEITSVAYRKIRDIIKLKQKKVNTTPMFLEYMEWLNEK